MPRSNVSKKPSAAKKKSPGKQVRAAKSPKRKRTVRPKEVAKAGQREENLYDDPDVTGELAIDDPVRMYLMQMGEIPLLTRDQEIEFAKRIESTRATLSQQHVGQRLCAARRRASA